MVAGRDGRLHSVARPGRGRPFALSHRPTTMPALPLPFVAALLLAILCARLLLAGDEGRRLTPAAVFVAACAVLLVVVGLRWSIDSPLIRFLQPVTAACLPPLAWICFARLSTSERPRLQNAWPHALPVVLAFGLSATWRLWHPPIDLVIAVIFLGYGLRLALLSKAGPDRLTAARFGDTARAVRSMRLVGGLLIASGLTDLLIAVDFGFRAGRHAEAIVAVANLIGLPVIAWAVAVLGSRPPPEAVPAAPPAEAESDDREVIAAVDALMRERELFRDPDLTLDRLARRLGLPARRISAAINRHFGRNVSQVVNEYRVAAARVRLGETDEAVTRIMYDCGFQTKSNFNREFRRVVGTTPTAYRDGRRRTGVTPASGARPPAGSP